MSNIFVINRGDTETITLVIKEEGIPLNITGFKCYLTVKKKLSDPDSQAIITKDWTMHSNPLQGETFIKLLPQDTTKLPGKYYYDVQLKKPDGDIQSIQYGICEIRADVTSRTT